jgi:hypothetical protein
MFERGDTVSWQTTSSRRLFGVVYDIDGTIGVKPIGDKEIIYIQPEFLKLEERPGVGRIIEISAGELMYALGELGFGVNTGVYKLRISVEGDRVKLKANERCWTAAVGHLDPYCQLAQQRASVDRRAENEPLTSNIEGNK